MSFKGFLKKKNISIVEFNLQEFRDSLLADVSDVLLSKKEEAEEIFIDSINMEQTNDFLKSVNYSKSLAFEVCLNAKNTAKIREHLQEIEKKTTTQIAKLQLDYLKNNIFNYILKIERKNFDSKDVDLVLENKIAKVEKSLSNLETIFKKFDFIEIKKIILKPTYESANSSKYKFEVTVNENTDALFICEETSRNILFKNLVILTRQEKLKKEIESFYEFCQKNLRKNFNA